MNPVFWFDILFVAALVILFVDQIIIPLVRKRPMFPGFGKGRHSKSQLKGAK